MDFTLCGGALVPDIVGDLSFELDHIDRLDTFHHIKPDVVNEDPLADFDLDNHSTSSLSMFEFDNMKDLTLEIDALVRGTAGTSNHTNNTTAEKRTILDELDTKDKIRRDCMWSSGHSINKFLRSEGSDARGNRWSHTTTTASRSGPPYSGLLAEEEEDEEDEMSLTPPTSYINLYLRNLETPLNSDEDSSELSGDEIDLVTDDWTSMVMLEQQQQLENRLLEHPTSADGSNRDHCYSSSTSRKMASTLTPPESSEDDEDSHHPRQSCYASRLGNPESMESPGQLMRTVGRGSRVLKSVDNDRLNKSVRNLFPSTTKKSSLQRCTAFSTSLSSPKLSSYSSTSSSSPSATSFSKPKFTFKVNFKAKLRNKNKNKYLQNTAMFNLTNPSNSILATSTSNSPSSSPNGGVIERPKDARDLHNHMERKRRTELKNAFDMVKNSVPTISTSDRVSKQMILDRAIEYCRSMRAKEAAVNKRKRTLQQRNTMLLKQLQSLQQNHK